MYKREESKKLRQLFWTSFGKSYPRKWILYNTQIKGLSLKFYFDTKKAMVTLDVELEDLGKRIAVWDRLIGLAAIIKSDFLPNAEFEDSYVLENNKEISRIYVILNDVSVHNKETWRETMHFLNKNMSALEHFFEHYKAHINP